MLKKESSNSCMSSCPLTPEISKTFGKENMARALALIQMSKPKQKTQFIVECKDKSAGKVFLQIGATKLITLHLLCCFDVQLNHISVKQCARMQLRNVYVFSCEQMRSQTLAPVLARGHITQLEEQLQLLRKSMCFSYRLI